MDKQQKFRTEFLMLCDEYEITADEMSIEFLNKAYDLAIQVQARVVQKNAEGLLPCPFCKSDPQIASLDGDQENWIILCPNCLRASVEMGVGGAETKEDCIAMWNERI